MVSIEPDGNISNSLTQCLDSVGVSNWRAAFYSVQNVCGTEQPD